jgi:hypothetical protein
LAISVSFSVISPRAYKIIDGIHEATSPKEIKLSAIIILFFIIIETIAKIKQKAGTNITLSKTMALLND